MTLLYRLIDKFVLFSSTMKQEHEQPKAESPERAEEGKTEDSKAEDAAKPLPPMILFVDLHCIGCAKKIERSITRIKGVEGVVIDTVQNQVTIRGGELDPQAVCDRITQKTRRRAKVLSPLLPPTPTPENEQPLTPAAVEPPVSTLLTKTVELNVNTQCEDCAGKLKRKILKMEGVEKVETELRSRKVTVTGTMDVDKLMDYVYLFTKAQIVPQPEPEPESKNQEGGDKIKEKVEEKPAEDTSQGKEEEEKDKDKNGDKKDDNAKEEEKKKDEEEEEVVELDAEDVMKRMTVNYYLYQQQSLYVVERLPPPPQLFSDENPNACSIS